MNRYTSLAASFFIFIGLLISPQARADTILNDFQINTEFPGHPPQDNPYSVANWQTQRIYTTFLSKHDGTNWDVALARHNYDLQPVGQTTYLNVREGTYNCLRPKLVIRSTGVGAAWIEARSPNRIMFRSLDGNGNPTCPPVRVEDDFSNVLRDSLSIAALYDGFLLVWYDNRDSSEIWAQKVNLSGQLIGPNFPVQPDSTGSILGLEAQNHPDGRVLVSWVTNGQYSRGRWLDSLGNFMGEVFEMAEAWMDQIIAKSMVRFAGDSLGALYQYSATEIGQVWNWAKYSYLTYLDSTGFQQSPIMQIGSWSGHYEEGSSYDDFHYSFPDMLLMPTDDYSLIRGFQGSGYGMGGFWWDELCDYIFSSLVDTSIIPWGLVSDYNFCALNDSYFLYTFDLGYVGLRKYQFSNLDSSEQIIWIYEPNFGAPQNRSALDVHENGSFRAIYNNFLEPSPYVYTRFFDEYGAPSSIDLLVSRYENLEPAQTTGGRIIGTTNNQSMVVWPCADGINYTIFTGPTWTGQVDTFNLGASYDINYMPALDVNSNNHNFLLWDNYYEEEIFTYTMLFGQTFQQLFNYFVPAFQITSPLLNGSVGGFDVGLRDDGRFVICWSQIWQGPEGINIRAGSNYNQLNPGQLNIYCFSVPVLEVAPNGYWLAWRYEGLILLYQLDSDGNFVDSIRIISADDAIGAGNPALAVFSSDNFAVCWQDARNDSGDIYCRQFNPDGSFFGNEYRVNSDPVGVMQKEPAVAFGPEDRLYFTWTDFRNPGGQGDIYCKVIEWEDALDAPVYQPPLPRAFALYPPSPNPFNPVTVLSFQLPVPSFVSLRVYDIAGRLIKTLLDRKMEAGSHQVLFDGSGLASGIYIARLRAGDFVAAEKLVLLK